MPGPVLLGRHRPNILHRLRKPQRAWHSCSLSPLHSLFASTWGSPQMDNGYRLVMDKKRIAKQYLQFWFWVDILATSPW